MSFISIKKKKAFTLVELLISVGIIALLSLGAFVVYPKYKIHSSIQQELQIIDASVRDFVGDGAVSMFSYVYGDTENTLLNSKAIPAYFRAPAGAAYPLYLKSIDSLVAIGPLSNTYPFWITTIIDAPSEACRPYVTRFYNQYDQIFPYSDNGGVGSCYSWVPARKPPLDTILAACDAYVGSNGRIWIGFLNKVKGKGGCNIPY